jgi:hypothetical protein
MIRSNPIAVIPKLTITYQLYQSIMSERERSRSRSPARDGESAPADNGAPPANDAPPAGAGGGEEVKLYVGNLDYGTFVERSECSFLLPFGSLFTISKFETYHFETYLSHFSKL